MDQNLNPGFDLPDIQQDIPYIQHLGPSPSTGAGTRRATTSSRPTRAGRPRINPTSPITTGPQYFGYLANTPPLRPNFRGLTDFFTDMANNCPAPRRRVLHPRRLHEPNGAVAADHQPQYTGG